jgi:uncharacterized protein (TIGR02246 family)
MATQTVEQEIQELEGRYWDAIRDRDIEAALRLTDEPCLLTGAQGVASIGHDAYRGMMQSGSWTLHSYEIGDDVQVRALGDDLAIIAYTVTERMTVDGKPLTLEAADSSVWVRRDGRWLCCLHTESVKGDSLGRDRQRAG